MLQDEDGLTLAEVLVSVVILGTTFMLFASMFVRNQQFIELNEKIKEAQYVRDDIKEWIGYRAQTQDLAMLNQSVMVLSLKGDDTLTEDEKTRINYLVLDKSGLPRNSPMQPPRYGESIPDLTGRVAANKEASMQKVDYQYEGKNSTLPNNFKEASGRAKEEAKYLGKYIGSKTKHSFLVICRIKDKVASKDYRKEGLDVVLEVYDEKTGKLLTDTIFKWVVDY